MKTLSTNMSIAQLCKELEENSITVNRNYQRSDKIWPETARSFLIETILLDFPVPKIALYQSTDLKTKRTTKEIVDGQQRTSAVFDFFKGKLKLSKTIERDEFKNRTFDELDDDSKGRFLSYSLSIDVFAAATPEDIAEVFRRMNSYTVPLNPEEQRHANYQGEFKWFISGLSHELSGRIIRLGIFDEKRIVRMEDTKLLTDVCYALQNGIITTKRTQLDSMYKKYDKGFPSKDETGTLIKRAIDDIEAFPGIKQSALMKPYNAYALILALIHIRAPVGPLRTAFPLDTGLPSYSGTAEQKLTELADAIDREGLDGPYGSFVRACKEKTNVGEQRIVRFQYFCRALTE